MIAGFIFLRLRGILGKRTGFEGKASPQFEEIMKNINPETKINKKNDFDENAKKDFLKGAKIAYETIITDFGDSDNKLTTSKPLLSNKIYDQFNKHHIEGWPWHFRHQHFWDGAVHCLTMDTIREGGQEDYFN